MATQPWRTGKIIKIENETSSTKRFWIEIEGVDHFEFVPGQFITLDLPIHEQPNKRWRSYSIASAPDHSNVVELVIVLMEGVLPDPITTDLFMICTGTGIAPFRSMLQHIHHNNIPHKEIYLIYGTRKCPDALYLNEMLDLKQKLPGFHYFPTFSREEQVAEGLCIGYVHGVYEQLLQEPKDDPQFFLCGWKDMITDARQKIQARGIDKKSIHFELYG